MPVDKRTAVIVRRILPKIEKINVPAFALMGQSLRGDDINKSLDLIRALANDIVNAIDEYREGY